jgi:hypothetical protein
VSAVVPELQNVKDHTSFNIKIHGLRLLNFSQVLPSPAQTFHLIMIEVPGNFCFKLHAHDFQIHDKLWIVNLFVTQCPQKLNADIEGPLSEIASKVVSISILDKTGAVVDQLRMKLSHLSTGPIKHDHLLKNLKSRLLFDCQIDQHLGLEVALRDFNIDWLSPSLDND